MLPVTSVTVVLDKVLELASSEASSRVAKLEGPEELGGSLEVRASSDNLVDKVLDRDDAVLAKLLLDEAVVGEGDALLVDLGVAALVDELPDRLHVGFTVCDVWLDELKHLSGSLAELDEHAIVDLQQTEEL